MEEVQKLSVKAKIEEAIKAAKILPTYFSLYLLNRYKNILNKSITLSPEAKAESELTKGATSCSLPKENKASILATS